MGREIELKGPLIPVFIWFCSGQNGAGVCWFLYWLTMQISTAKSAEGRRQTSSSGCWCDGGKENVTKFTAFLLSHWTITADRRTRSSWISILLIVLDAVSVQRTKARTTTTTTTRGKVFINARRGNYTNSSMILLLLLFTPLSSLFISCKLDTEMDGQRHYKQSQIC